MSLTLVNASTSLDPSIVIVSLPPGLSLEQFRHLEYTIVTTAITNAVVFGILAWDYLLLLPDELQLYGLSTWQTWGGPAVYSFLVLRYSGILSAFAALFYTAIQSDHCQTAVAISQLGAVLVVTSSGIIFGYRVSAMWEGHKAVNLLVGFMYLFMITAWVRPFVLDTYNYCSDAGRNSGGRCIAISRYERSFFASRLQLSATSHRAVGASILCLILRI